MPVLAADIGGTKTLLALVDGASVLERIERPTDREAGPEVWVSQMADLAGGWSDKFEHAGITVTGLVQDNRWQALNPETLAFPGQYALFEAVEDALGVPVTLCNDAQAAAWGEHIHGVGKDQDIVFMTISTGIGGGVVAGGRLLLGRSGVAGHFGQLLPLPEGGSEYRFEDFASGRWVGLEGEKLGLKGDARSVFAAADEGNELAENIVQSSAARVAHLAHNLQLLFDPHITVIGGGIGLASGYIERMEASIAHLQPLVRPTFVRAALGKDSGVIGVADLSRRNQSNRKDIQ